MPKTTSTSKSETAAPAQPPAKTRKKPVEKAPVKKEAEVYLQFGENEWNMAQILEQAKAAYVAEGHRASALKSFSLYVKPEERKAYYVANEKVTGSIDL